MRRLLVCIVLGCVASLPAQTPSTPRTAPEVTFHATAELVEVPAIVRDGRGRHVPGLTKDQFVVLEDGVAQPIAHFEEVASAGTRPRRLALGPDTFSNAVVADSSTRVTVVLLDLINSSPPKQEHARTGLIKFLSSLGPTSEPIMLVVMTSGGMRVVHDFTTDTAVLLAAVKKVASRPDQRDIGTLDELANLQGQIDALDGMTEALQESAMIVGLLERAIDRQQLNIIERTDLTLQMLRQLTQALAGIPGRKSLLWSTEGLAYVESSDEAGMNWRLRPGLRSAYTPRTSIDSVTALNARFEHTWREMSSAGIAVYPLDLAEIDNPAFSNPKNIEAISQVYRSTGGMLKAMVMDGFTSSTGGHYCLLQVHMENCFREAVDDSSRYYVLSYYPSAKAKAGWRKLQVKVAAPDAHVRTRSGYLPRERNETPELRKQEIALALGSSLDFAAIPLTVHWLPPNPDAPAAQPFSLTIPANGFALDGEAQNHFRLTVISAPKTAEGQFAGGGTSVIERHVPPEALARIRSAGITYRGQVEIPAGAEVVRFVVKDEISGRMGSVTATVGTQAAVKHAGS